MKKLLILLSVFLLNLSYTAFADDAIMKVDDNTAVIQSTTENVVLLSDLKAQRDKVEAALNQTRVNLGQLQEVYDDLNSKIEQIENTQVQ